MLIGVLINVAFITLLERKILGYSQTRLGPNKPALYGLIQPFADAIKLFNNKKINSNSHLWISKITPRVSLFLALIIWYIFPRKYIFLRIEIRILLILILIRLRVYPIILIGWSSGRKYAKLGAIRRIAQTISYEVSLALTLLIIIISEKFLTFNEINFQEIIRIFLLPRIFIIWLVIRIRETNRTPFDFSERERELVSGFNVEYRRVDFTLIFIREYARIYFFSRITILIFLNNWKFFYILGFAILVIFWIWIRATFPRFRYDKLIDLNWKVILPLVLTYLFWITIITYYNKI